MFPPRLDPFFQDYEDLMKSIETEVIGFFHEQPELTDHQIDKTYEALQRRYEKQLKGKPAPKSNLKDIEEALYERLMAVLESWLKTGTYQDSRNRTYQVNGPVTLDEVITALKRLRRSINLWTRKTRGRQGYLDYIGDFIS